MDYGILERRAYAEVPPRVEYELNAFGQEFVTVLDMIEDLVAKYGPQTSLATKAMHASASENVAGEP